MSAPSTSNWSYVLSYMPDFARNLNMDQFPKLQWLLEPIYPWTNEPFFGEDSQRNWYKVGKIALLIFTLFLPSIFVALTLDLVSIGWNRLFGNEDCQVEGRPLLNAEVLERASLASAARTPSAASDTADPLGLGEIEPGEDTADGGSEEEVAIEGQPRARAFSSQHGEGVRRRSHSVGSTSTVTVNLLPGERVVIDSPVRPEGSEAGSLSGSLVMVNPDDGQGSQFGGSQSSRVVRVPHDAPQVQAPAGVWNGFLRTFGLA